ncbi:hypothetical protein GOB94_08625 [Granulicella sp. 5B5]|uniref:hypothetical protein n=1 Tax=Granulicella sp. 5B5 TaxID=1617967 RepID=UPI0015F352FF|nr:hypothetical protein [Granulicella sp. 5B5]QMV18739.1 hypothetical protein GOB94_08625 [Granulicella sp. 5B5]
MSTIAAPAPALEAAAKSAGLTLTAVEPGTDFTGTPTTRAVIALVSNPAKSQVLELSAAFNAADPEFVSHFKTFFDEAAHRLRNPHPDQYLTLSGLPLSFGGYAWPFHGSTSGADTYIVHGNINLEDGTEVSRTQPLHAKISASLTQTFAETLVSREQPFAEGFIYNAVRKTLDQGQLELVKSGNRQPVPVTTRYFSVWKKRFSFNDTTEKQRHDYLAAKVFWLSHILGGGEPVWIADPRDAQYLNTTAEELKQNAATLVKEGLLLLDESGEWATATDTLRTQEDTYRAHVADALLFIKPSFNEEMRGGHTNM